MKKKWAKFGVIALSSVLAASTVMGLAGCGKGGKDTELGDDGRPIPDGTITNITFWGYGDENEVDVFTELVAQFNEEYKDTIKVKYEPQPSDGYNESITTALQSSRAKVDVLYIPDAGFKRYAANGYLEPLDDYLANSKEVVVEEMWETSINRYKYDIETTTQDGPNAHYWGIPKDIGPTVIFYNETYFNTAGVKVISVATEDLDKFNSGSADSRGTTKAQYGIEGTVQEKGYFIDGKGQKWFNNQIPMSWDECVALSTLVQEAVRAQQGLNNIYGYYTEWWFNYGWSVGGDCIEYVPSDDPAYNGGYYDFTLMDPTPNYIVKDEYQGTLKINGHDYKAGEIIEWGDKVANPGASNKDKTIRQEVLGQVEAGNLNVLPSQRDAFVEFVRIGQSSDKVVDNGLYGYGICPAPSSIGSDADKTRQFQNGGIAMLVDGRWNVVNFRKVLGEYPGKPTKNGYEWDVAPLPMYKTYYEEGDNIPAGKSVGDIKVHGIEAGHSGSMALSINANSKKKNAAWLLCEYIGGEKGQTAQSKSGFAIPSQIKLANANDIFLQTDRNPRNSRAFLRAAEYEKAGDWWYLADKLWIDDWAGVLNGSVRNGTKTLTEFEQSREYLGTWDKLKTYTKK